MCCLEQGGKMKKITAFLLIVILALPMVACSGETVVLDEAKVYEIGSEIHSLDIRINAADFKIERADAFSVESNLKYLSVSEKDGVLTILDEAKNNSNYSDAMLTLCVPSGTVFENVSIATGAAKMTVDTLSADSLKLSLGAGDVRFESFNAFSDIEIKGGAGQITVADGTLNGLMLEMGVGELNLTAALLGGSKLKFGVGEANLTLLGGKDEYRMDIEGGLGNITVDGKTISDLDSIGNGQNLIEIDGGVGAINLVFRDKSK